MDASTASGGSPFMPMFEKFRLELDEHHDRRERVIKASRDVTAASKKMIRTVGKPIPPGVRKGFTQHEEVIRSQYTNISKDMQGLNSFRYQRQISGGNQELLEALTFQHYLETEQLLSYLEANDRVAGLGGPESPILLTPDDYLLGVFDMVGELMRHAVTAMATGELSGAASSTGNENIASRGILADMRDLRSSLERLEVDDGFLSRDIEKKMPVMKQCVEKVENAAYGLIVRGSERPKGWMPDTDHVGKGEVEGY
ncbi:Translin [Rhizodiscina lignyota]|uniref:Translin n=1 Tax=Rhizodiscina lignyota TaxID=1504668 RepID=A0A9P4IQ02_9PEZI|nr:Translin [Rhizodiscina lignyota]